MSVNTTLDGLSQTPAANGPDGASDPPSAIDDALRYHGAFIAMLRDSLMPIGSIISYRGTIGALPSNWKLCDGTAGTLDLRDRFIVGAGTSYVTGATGGSKDAITVAHTHGVFINSGTESATHSHTVNDSGHAHIAQYQVATGGAGFPGLDGGGDAWTTGATTTVTTGITLNGETATHTHTVSGTTGSAGAAGTGANLPPYYALMYIERVS